MIYLLDYIGLLFIRAGFFKTREDALLWVQQNDPDHHSYYTVVEVPEARNDGDLVIPANKYPRYANQR